LGVNRSGLDLLQEIRAQDQNLPVILSTAYDSFQHDLKSIAADYYVVKSVDLAELKDKVKMALDKAAGA
ncbi:MAG: response regulator, partial [Desulfovibrionaceae bacterium]|nr:response regulator [Desulfovibrionaceae bacterium]